MFNETVWLARAKLSKAFQKISLKIPKILKKTENAHKNILEDFANNHKMSRTFT